MCPPRCGLGEFWPSNPASVSGRSSGLPVSSWFRVGQEAGILAFGLKPGAPQQRTESTGILLTVLYLHP